MDLLKEAQAILNEDKDTKGYKVLFILEPTLTLHDDYYESEYMENTAIMSQYVLRQDPAMKLQVSLLQSVEWII